MRTDIPTKLPLASFARFLSIHPLHFAQIQYVPVSGRASQCAAPYFQYSWQAQDRISREEIAQAIFDAESRIEQLLGTRLLPSWERDEFVEMAKPTRPELVNVSNTDPRGYWATVQSRWGNVISGGVRGTQLIDTPTIVWTDEDADGYFETGTVTVATDDIACEIRLYFPGKLADPSWEIKPLTSVVVATGSATITFRRELCVLPALEESMSPEGVLATDNAKFLTEVDVYREYNDQSTHASILYEAFNGRFFIVPEQTAQGRYEIQTGSLLPRDPRVGLMTVAPGSWDVTDGWTAGCFWKAPDAVRLNYYAGLQDTSQQCGARDLDRFWGQTIAGFAASLLDRPPCDCSADTWEYWREDLSLDEGSEDFGKYRTPTGLLNNPLGTRRGAVEAWRKVRGSRDRIGQGA